MYKRYLKKLSRTRLDDVLIDAGILERAHVEDAQAESEMTGRPLSFVLFERDEMDEWELAKIVARKYSLPFVDVIPYSIPREAEVVLDIEFCRLHMLMPFDVFGVLPAVAVCEMPSEAALREIEYRCGGTPFLYVTLRSRLNEALDAREASGVAPATAADAPPPPSLGSGPVMTDDTGDADGEASSMPRTPPTGLGLEPVSMRLGFNMHMRSGRGKSVGSPLPQRRRAAARVRRLAPEEPSAAASPAPAQAVAAVAEESPSPEAVAAGEPVEEAASGAAWQSIFDLGDENVDV